MRDLHGFFVKAPANEFSGTVYRISPALYAGNIFSMRGSLLNGARYNIRGYFGALYTSLSVETARHEVARYFTVPPRDGFALASLQLRLNRMVDLTGRKLLRKAKIAWEDLVQPQHTITQEIGLRAWESGIEALLVPSAAVAEQSNLVLFLDNQHPVWGIELAHIEQLLSL
jgi:RES domain-containing protein